MSSNLHGALLVAAMSAVTILLRALPFGIFGGKRQVPKVIVYLGKVLPSAVLGMLVIYCLRDLQPSVPAPAARELLACAVVVLVQCLKRNSLWSIVLGTAAYLILGAVL